VRFGAATDALYQLAAGHRFSPLVPIPLEEPHTCSVDLDFPESNVERLIFVVKRMLDGLTAAIAGQVRAVAGLVLHLTLDNREQRTERVRPAAPTLDVAQLVTLIRLRLDSLQLPAGIVALRLTADTCAADAGQRALFALHARRDAEGANQAFARLRAECGDRSVVRARLCDAHLPGARFVWEPLETVPLRAAPRVVASRPLVRRIVETPMQWDGPRPHFAGPYVIAGGWWKGGVQRDYYFARTESGQTCWIYDDHRRDRVFLQGYVE
jgi:protein ImuB